MILGPLDYKWLCWGPAASIPKPRNETSLYDNEDWFDSSPGLEDKNSDLEEGDTHQMKRNSPS